LDSTVYTAYPTESLAEPRQSTPYFHSPPASGLSFSRAQETKAYAQ